MTAPFPMTWVPSPNHYHGRGGVELDTIVMHYDVNPRDEQATARLFQKSRNSAHFCVGRDAGVAQCVDVDDAAWHAGDGGKSRIPSAAQIDAALKSGNLSVPIGQVPPQSMRMNQRSIGIEQGNMGWGKGGPNPYVYGIHRNPACRSTQWESWNVELIDRSVELVRWLKQIRPTIRFLTGHEDVCHSDTIGDDPNTPEVEKKSGGKTDPGAVFPWERFRGLGLIRVFYDFHNHCWVIDPGTV